MKAGQNSLDVPVTPGLDPERSFVVGSWMAGNYVPPAWVVYWTFRLMVGAGTVMIALAIYGLFLSMAELLRRLAAVEGLHVPIVALPSFWPSRRRTRPCPPGAVDTRADLELLGLRLRPLAAALARGEVMSGAPISAGTMRESE